MENAIGIFAVCMPELVALWHAAGFTFGPTSNLRPGSNRECAIHIVYMGLLMDRVQTNGKGIYLLL